MAFLLGNPKNYVWLFIFQAFLPSNLISADP